MLFEHRRDYNSEWAAIQSIAEKVGVHKETLRIWVRCAQVDAGLRPGLTTEEREQLRQLLRRTKSPLRLRAAAETCSAWLALGGQS
jgi:transposase-like protein